MTLQPIPALRRESTDSVLAKNLVIARIAAGFTQQALAQAADVSRATIAQIETGYSDPRLSTIVDLAHALHISPILLLSGVPEVSAMAALLENEERLLQISAQDLNRMSHWAGTGMLKDRLRAGRIGAAIAQAAGRAVSGVIGAAVFSAIHPGLGTSIGATFGDLSVHGEVDQKPAGPVVSK